MKEKNTYFDPDTSFFELKVVKFTALSFILIFLIACIIIIQNSMLWGKWNLTHSGFNNLLEYFKVPLGFLALMIPVGAVFAANHRSEQTKKQIALTHNQNLFINYYKHIEEFEKFIEKSLPTVFTDSPTGKAKEREKLFNSRHAHKVLFQGLIHTGNTKANREFLDKLDNVGINMFAPLSNEQVVSTNQLRTSLMTAILQIEKILKRESISFGGLLSSELEAKATKLEEYETFQTRAQESTDPLVIRNGADCHYIADFITRIELIYSVLDTCARFDTSYSGLLTLSAIEASKNATLMDNSNVIKDPHIKLLSSNTYYEDEIATTRSPFGQTTLIARDLAIEYTLTRVELFNKYIASQS